MDISRCSNTYKISHEKTTVHEIARAFRCFSCQHLRESVKVRRYFRAFAVGVPPTRQTLDKLPRGVGECESFSAHVFIVDPGATPKYPNPDKIVGTDANLPPPLPLGRSLPSWQGLQSSRILGGHCAKVFIRVAYVGTAQKCAWRLIQYQQQTKSEFREIWIQRRWKEAQHVWHFIESEPAEGLQRRQRLLTARFNHRARCVREPYFVNHLAEVQGLGLAPRRPMGYQEFEELRRQQCLEIFRHGPKFESANALVGV